MNISIASVIRRIAAFIEEDDTPTDEEIKARRKQLGMRPPSDEPLALKVHVKNEVVKNTAPSKIKRPRRLREHQKKWNEDNKTGLMKDYMQQYRAEGKDLETNSPNSKYVKKPKM